MSLKTARFRRVQSWGEERVGGFETSGKSTLQDLVTRKGREGKGDVGVRGTGG